uniref:Dynein light intermediate chain n=1 Tax=Glossina brevipalpis TaxID=37001 RepID=A0A1A9WAG1_9MUSC
MDPQEKAEEQVSKIRVSRKTVIVLGEKGVGKRTLLKKLQGTENPILGSGLKYAYIDIKEESQKDITRLNIWILDSIPGNENLLRMVLNTTNYTQTSIVLTVSMAQPWYWMDQLTDCSEMLSRHVKNLRVDPKEKEEARQRLLEKWQSCSKEIDIDSSEKREEKNCCEESEDDSLTEEALKINLGLDIAVVVTQTDRITDLRNDYGYQDEHFTFMEQWIRRFCLQHGAPLLCTSAKNEKNCDLLHEYLTHRIKTTQFRVPLQTAEKDTLSIPFGWDSLKKMGILPDNMEPCGIEEFYSTLPSEKKNEQDIFLEPKHEEENEVPKPSGVRKRKKRVPKITPITLAYYFDIMHKKTGASPARREAMRISHGLDGLLDPEKIDSLRLSSNGELIGLDEKSEDEDSTCSSTSSSSSNDNSNSPKEENKKKKNICYRGSYSNSTKNSCPTCKAKGASCIFHSKKIVPSTSGAASADPKSDEDEEYKRLRQHVSRLVIGSSCEKERVPNIEFKTDY